MYELCGYVPYEDIACGVAEMIEFGPPSPPDISDLHTMLGVAMMTAAGGKFEIDEANTGHMFRSAPGHLTQDTPANRQIVLDTANDPANYVGTNKIGVATYRRSLADGRQAWAEVYNGKITNGGVNDVPRT